ncbi:hypothetical protein EDF81_1494 [Enterobacter sp. BIGb0383]|uniref:nitrogen fixation protein NifS n=1 Tax=unclassified Enterobacter TaxID=2608935 RepID=UPI000FB0536C|nr:MULTISPECIES: nitrogen fixation protein NifS [unclassified Enterobacter]ROP62980.1 hypothetical protein EDF81_1494 [Enterobacter sp. BIGb0383]ROS13141.1 hypothetical protein EC848_1496 [Enterobacter sp. BIGb0359]
MKKMIYFIYMPSQLLGRYPLQGVNGAGIWGNLFGLGSEMKYIQALDKYINTHYPEWSVERDNTESDIEKLIAQGAVILICAPGLKYQFYTSNFNKKNIIHLSTMEYATNNLKPVTKLIKELDDAK